MKFSEFRELCQREWDKCHGDIITLWLTSDSYRELQEESLMRGAADEKILHVSTGYEEASHASWGTWERARVPVASLNTVTNPLTRTPVRMKLARDKDAAECFSGTTKQFYTLVLGV